jgi:hypothetical protein
MKVGFTGTQQGMTMVQADTCAIVLSGLEPVEFHHGDCVGADAQACEIVWRLPWCYEGKIKVVSHPPDNDKKRAHTQAHVELPPLPYLERNQKIVDATEILVAAPAAMNEEGRSGTWATVRYARKKGKPVLLVLPDGQNVMDADYRPPHVWPDVQHPKPPTGFDTEAELIRPGLQAPPMVCMQLAWSPRDYELVHHTEARPYFEALLEQDLIAGANAAFDFAVGAVKWPDLIPRIFEAYEDGRITDVLIREKLLHIAQGVYRGYRREDGTGVHLGYALDDVVQRRCGVVLVKGERQLRFGELKDTPVSFWPEAAATYAVQDAIAPVEVWKKQEEARAEALRKYDADFLEDEFRQARAEWWIQLMSCWGLRCDPVKVREFVQGKRREYDELAEFLIQAKLCRREKRGVVRNEKLTREYMAYVCAVNGKKPARTKGGKKGDKPQPKIDDDSCQRLGDDLLKKYGTFSSLTKTLSTDIPLLESGTVVPIQANFELLETGRTSSSPNVQNWPTEQGMRECIVPREGHVFAIGDYSGVELRTWSQCIILNGWTSRMADFLNSGGDPHIEIACRILGDSYEACVADYKQDPKGRVYYPRQSGKVCFHPDTEVLTRLGWKNITHLTMEDEVCSAKLHDDGQVDLEWERPLRLTTRRFEGEIVHLKNEGIDLRVTPDHRMCGWRRVGYRDGRVREFVETVSPDKLGNLRYWPNAGGMLGGVQVDERLLRIAVATQADGSFKGKRISLGFTKQRKIERMRGLLREDEYNFTITGKLRVSVFYLTAEFSAQVRALLTSKKTLPWWWIELEPRLRAVVLEEAQFWDSGATAARAGYTFCTTIEENADVLQAIATLTYTKSRKTTEPRKQAHHADSIKVSIKTKHRSRGGNLRVDRIPYDGDVYCLTTRNDTVVVRDGGVPVITRQCNFGKPGGLGVQRLIDYARKNYGVILTEAKAKELSQFWFEAWPESRQWFAWIKILTSVQAPRIRQFYSNRYRGDVGFCDGANTFFQGLAADLAKAAGFLIAKACYVDRDSPLYGGRLVNFIHDEFVVEVLDNDNAHDAAVELGGLMCEGARPWIPDVPPVVEPLLARRWSKAAKPLFHPRTGRLVPWDFGVADELKKLVAA